jgi:hypothetical protein
MAESLKWHVYMLPEEEKMWGELRVDEENSSNFLTSEMSSKHHILL